MFASYSKKALLVGTALAVTFYACPDLAYAGKTNWAAGAKQEQAFSASHAEQQGMAWVPTLEEELAWIPTVEEAAARGEIELAWVPSVEELISRGEVELTWVPTVYQVEAAEQLVQEVMTDGLTVVEYTETPASDNNGAVDPLPAPEYVAREERVPEESEEFFTASVSDTELDDVRGANITAEALGAAVLEAVSAHNSSQGSVTGSNVISEDVFGNAQGIATIIQNSGNNVIIQSATVVNLSLSN